MFLFLLPFFFFDVLYLHNFFATITILKVYFVKKFDVELLNKIDHCKLIWLCSASEKVCAISDFKGKVTYQIHAIAYTVTIRRIWSRLPNPNNVLGLFWRSN